MATPQQVSRIKNELKAIQSGPPPGVTFWLKDENLSQLEANIVGPSNTPYENGVFKLDIQIPDKYPFEPPVVQFITPIYHPNIDTKGRICIDVLKMPPNGSWKPIFNISHVLRAIQELMECPNAEDALLPLVGKEYLDDRQTFVKNATELTEKHAKNNNKLISN